MTERGPYRIPSISALIAFESAARKGSFTGAAEELRTSQSALSRRIAALEDQLATRLFERSRSGVTLTPAGFRFRDAVVAGLGVIQVGTEEAAGRPEAGDVVIACSHDVSQLVMFPRFGALREALGSEVGTRVLIHRSSPQYRHVEPNADLVVTWSADDALPGVAPEDAAVILGEEIQPICSPEYAAAHAEIVHGPVAGWGALTFLDLSQPNMGWTSWSDWFESAGSPAHSPRFELLDSYIQVLEATACGRGIAMGWRHFIERYLDAGAVVALGEGFVEFNNRLVAVLTETGRRNPNARRCLPLLRLSE
ncbi:MAG: LysR family transcriptional regulator [Defluviicoccus sp.]|nr:LysR family transcriptional regulator [Defluviicoccus sp.]MDE0382377.1 LysR family transcriptional regulator [Defluviicoccus sp.]